MGFMTRFKPQCQGDDDECGYSYDSIRGLCGNCDGHVGYCFQCRTAQNPANWLYCSPCYYVKVEIPPIFWVTSGGGSSFTMGGGSPSVVEGEIGGAVCIKYMDCGDGQYACTWNDRGATAQSDGHGSESKPLPCCDEQDYCDDEFGNPRPNKGTGVGSFVGSYLSSFTLKCTQGMYSDVATKIGVWVKFSTVPCNCGQNCIGHSTIMQVELVPYLLYYGCYVNFSTIFQGGNDAWSFYGESTCVSGCGCPEMCKEITCESFGGDVWSMQPEMLPRICYPCPSNSTPIAYFTGFGHNEIGSAKVTITEAETPCGFDWYT